MADEISADKATPARNKPLHSILWSCKIKRRMDATTALSATFPEGIHFGLDESGARTEADTKRPKSSVSERWEHSDRVLLGCEPASEFR